ncbi:hypothetical protein J4G07_05375 [Candidatus Poribacteria bacterium]|nr:hypothetical protein [Candidatus Poribacteria bacterium]
MPFSTLHRMAISRWKLSAISKENGVAGENKFNHHNDLLIADGTILLIADCFFFMDDC